MDESIEVKEAISVSDSVTIRIRTYHSIQHIQSAAYLARVSAGIEMAAGAVHDSDALSDDLACVMGCLFAAAAFLEALINELLADAWDPATVPAGDARPMNPYLRSLPEDTLAAWSDTWRMWERTAAPILTKYQVVLALAHRSPFRPGTAVYDDAHLLITLRNALVHAQPETVLAYSTQPGVAVQVQQWERKLRQKFALNPMTTASSVFFPTRCLGHGCAAWVVQTSIGFADAFFARLGLQPTYDHVRSRLGVA